MALYPSSADYLAINVTDDPDTQTSTPGPEVYDRAWRAYYDAVVRWNKAIDNKQVDRFDVVIPRANGDVPGHFTYIPVHLDNPTTPGRWIRGQTNLTEVDITGSRFADDIAGSPMPNYFHASGGADTLRGGNKNDTFDYQGAALYPSPLLLLDRSSITTSVRSHRPAACCVAHAAREGGCLRSSGDGTVVPSLSIADSVYSFAISRRPLRCSGVAAQQRLSTPTPSPSDTWTRSWSDSAKDCAAVYNLP